MKTKGFTIVEMVVTIGILVIAATISIPLYGNWQIENYAESTKNSIGQFLFLARSRAQAGFHDSKHGVYIDDVGKTAVYYEGENYLSRAAKYDRTHDYSDSLAISSSFTGNEIIFDKGLGKPSATGTISIIGSNPPSLYTISINSTGLIE